MPAWIAGIQARKDASGDIHVNLDSSAPCWNDAFDGVAVEITETSAPGIFGAHQEQEEEISRKDQKIIEVKP